MHSDHDRGRTDPYGRRPGGDPMAPRGTDAGYRRGSSSGGVVAGVLLLVLLGVILFATLGGWGGRDAAPVTTAPADGVATEADPVIDVAPDGAPEAQTAPAVGQETAPAPAE